MNSALKENLKKFFTNKLIIICCIYAAFYFLSGFWKWFQIINCLIAIVCFVLFTPQESFCILLFAHSFTQSKIIYDFTFAVVMISFTILLLIKYIIGLKQKKYFIHKPLAIIFSILTISSIIISFPFGIYPPTLLYLMYMPLFYLIFTMKNDFNLKQAVNYLFMGLIFSSVLGFIAIFMPNYKLSTITGTRFHGFTNNPNNIYQRAIFIITYYMYQYLRNNLSHIKFYTSYGICSIITLLSGSKTGLIFLLLFTLIFIVLFLSQDFKKRYKLALIFIVAVTIIMFLLRNYVAETVSRFFNSNENFISAILTNRDKIWILYINGWLENPFTCLFGRGLLSMEVYFPLEQSYVGSHNLYLFLLYRFGIIGTLAFAYCIYLVIKHHKDFKFSFISFLPMLWLILQNMCDNTFRHFNIMYIVFCFMAMFESKKEVNSETKVKEENTSNTTP